MMRRMLYVVRSVVEFENNNRKITQYFRTQILDAALPGGSSKEQSKSGLSSGVGTFLYQAPEQSSSIVRTNRSAGRAESSKSPYDHKADIYPLGIILMEMWLPPFSTRVRNRSSREYHLCITHSHIRGNIKTFKHY